MVEFLIVNSNDVRPPMLTKRVIFEFQTIEHSPLIINYSVRSSCNDDPKEVYALVVAHDKAHPKQELSGILKQNLVMAAQAKYLELGIEISREKIANQLKFQIRKIRGIIRPENTPRGLAKRAIGTSGTSYHPSQMKVSNAIHNPKNNPIYNRVLRSECDESMKEKTGSS